MMCLDPHDVMKLWSPAGQPVAAGDPAESQVWIWMFR